MMLVCPSHSFNSQVPFRIAERLLHIGTQERFITWINTHEHVRWVPMIEMARSFRAKTQPAPGARMPTGFKPDAVN